MFDFVICHFFLNITQLLFILKHVFVYSYIKSAFVSVPLYLFLMNFPGQGWGSGLLYSSQDLSKVYSTIHCPLAKGSFLSSTVCVCFSVFVCVCVSICVCVRARLSVIE